MVRCCKKCRFWDRISDEYGNCAKITEFLKTDSEKITVKWDFKCESYHRIKFELLYRYDLCKWFYDIPFDKIDNTQFKSSSNIFDSDIVIFIDTDGQTKILKNRFSKYNVETKDIIK